MYFVMPTLKETELKEVGKNKQYRIKAYPIIKNDVSMGLSYWYFTLDSNYTTNIYIQSPEVPKDIIGISTITEMGILTIYTAIVMVVYSLIKTDYVGISPNVMFENMKNCEGLLQLCDDIILARQDDDLALEEELSQELLEIYRSPELLIEKSKP